MLYLGIEFCHDATHYTTTVTNMKFCKMCGDCQTPYHAPSEQHLPHARPANLENPTQPTDHEASNMH